MGANKPIDLTELLEPYKGKWVTLTSDQKRVLGSGNTMDEALHAAADKNNQRPILLKVPDGSTTIIPY